MKPPGRNTTAIVRRLSDIMEAGCNSALAQIHALAYLCWFRPERAQQVPGTKYFVLATDRPHGPNHMGPHGPPMTPRSCPTHRQCAVVHVPSLRSQRFFSHQPLKFAQKTRVSAETLVALAFACPYAVNQDREPLIIARPHEAGWDTINDRHPAGNFSSRIAAQLLGTRLARRI